MSSGSQILAPRNSSIDTTGELNFDSEIKTYKEPKHEMISFKHQAKVAEQKYEQEHNRNMDMGVYQGEVVDHD